MKIYRFILLLLLPLSVISQDWIEYPSDCDSTSIVITQITELGHYVGYIPITRQGIYSTDRGVTWQNICDYENMNGLFQTESISPNDDIVLRYRNLAVSYNSATEECETLVTLPSSFTSDVLLLDNGNIVVTSLGDVYFYDSDGNISSQIEYGINVRSELIHYQQSYPSYITYETLSDGVVLRELDVINQTIGAEVSIPDSYQNQYVYSNGVLFSSDSWSQDGGLSWTAFSDINPNEIFLAHEVLGDDLFILTDKSSYHSSDRGLTFDVNSHDFSFNSGPRISIVFLSDRITIYDSNLSNHFVATTNDFGQSWNNESTSIEVPSNNYITAAQNEYLYSSNICGSRKYNPSTSLWEENTLSFFSDVDALPNDNLITVDFENYLLSKDLGETWEVISFEEQIIEYLTAVVSKEDITYLPGFNQMFYTQDNGNNFTYSELPFWLEMNQSYGLYPDFEVMTYNRFSSTRDQFFVHNILTDQQELINKFYNSDIHLDMETSWNGEYIYFLEYGNDSQTDLVLKSSADKGDSFTTLSVPFLSGTNISLITDHLGNIIVYSTKQIIISMDGGVSWLELTPSNNGFERITDITVSYDDYLYASTFGSGVIRLECKLSGDFTQCIMSIIDEDNDNYSAAVDCDDMNPNVNPGQVEIPYNGLDDDCNPLTLEDDLDKDSFVLSEDCDDMNPNVNPGQVEIPYNGLDDDCDPLTLEDDLDEDSFVLSEDCDDMNPNVNPDQVEIPYNGLDDDCDPLTLEDDLDEDSFVLSEDCDDMNPNVNPDQVEIPYNGLDDDCNPLTLEDDLDEDSFVLSEDCDDMNPNVNPDQVEIAYNGLDDDCDPMTLEDDLDEDNFLVADDCDDTDPNINPDAVEIPNNDVDEDCDGEDLVTSVSNIFSIIQKVFPNPVVNELNIVLSENIEYRITIYNHDGKSILSEINKSKIDVSTIDAGVYVLEVYNLNTGIRYSEKIVIMK